MTYQAIYLEWLDSTMKLPVWHTTGNLVDSTKSPKDFFKTTGWLVNQNKHEYIICASLHFDENGGLVNMGAVLTIPKGCVTKIVKIKIPIK